MAAPIVITRFKTKPSSDTHSRHIASSSKTQASPYMPFIRKGLHKTNPGAAGPLMLKGANLLQLRSHPTNLSHLSSSAHILGSNLGALTNPAETVALQLVRPRVSRRGEFKDRFLRQIRRNRNVGVRVSLILTANSVASRLLSNKLKLR